MTTPNPELWRTGLHALHCREDRCGDHGGRCSCPCHQGETMPELPTVSYDTGDPRLDEIFTRLDEHARRLNALLEAGKTTSNLLSAIIEILRPGDYETGANRDR